MRSLSLFALILASLTLAAASDQHYRKPRAKPDHSESKHSEEKQSGGKQGKGAVAPDKKLTSQASNSQELRHLEAQTVKASGSNRSAKQRARTARVVKAGHEKPNPPIRFSSAEGKHGSMNEQGKNPYKGRVRQKGNNKR